MLLRVEQFVKNYVIIKNQMIAECRREVYQNGINKEILNCLNLLFYQQVSDNNKFSPKLSSNHIKRCLKDDCIAISFPNSYFKGYWPQYLVQKNKTMLRRNGDSIMPYGDSVLDFVFSKNYRWEKIWRIVNNDDLFTREYIEENVKDSFSELKLRERNVDVTISDYIEKYYKDKELFYSPNHPSNDVMKIVTYRCLEKIGIIVDYIDDEGILPNNANEILLYPCVKKALNLKWDKQEYIFARALGGNLKSSFYEYILQYQKECFRDYQYKHKEIQIHKGIYIDSNFVLHNESSISVNECICYINIKLECVIESSIEDLFKVQKGFAPITTFYSMCRNLVGNCCMPMMIDNSGMCKLLNRFDIKKGDVLDIDMRYHLK